MTSKEQPLSGKHYDLISDLLDACRTGRIADLLGLLREDIQLLADHREEEGKDFLRMVGLGQCSKFLKAVARSGKTGPAYTIREIAGRPAALFLEPGRPLPVALLFFEKEGQKLSRIYCFRHPERIRRQLTARELPGMRREGRRHKVKEG